jgi:4-hydroxybenzoate polyprenyltransferase
MSVAAGVRLARPFTLLAPALGMVAGGVAALGHAGDLRLDGWVVRQIGLGALAALTLNVASNAVNQIFDLEVDRINKPERPLPAGELSVRAAAWVTGVAYALSLVIAAAVNTPLLVIVAFTAALTYAYSGPPFRTKRHWALANLTIAAPRGFLLPLAGWVAISGSVEGAAFGEVFPVDAWVVAAAGGLFILGAATTKDYADLEGDEANGCITLPLRFGIERSVRMVAPFLFLPWLLFPAGVAAGWLQGNHALLFWGGLALAAVGARAGWLLVRRPDALTGGSTHPAWVLMYLIMLGSQGVVAFGYAVAPTWLAGAAP